MCGGNNDCEYEGAMLVAYGPKDLYVCCIETDTEIRVPNRIQVDVCPDCGEPNWRTVC